MWDGELVVYDDLSGDTSKLDPLMTVIFMQLLEKPARTIDLVARLAGELGVDNDPKLHRLTEIALGRLAGSGLVQPEPGPAVRRQ